jgi:hypothetical protein
MDSPNKKITERRSKGKFHCLDPCGSQNTLYILYFIKKYCQGKNALLGNPSVIGGRSFIQDQDGFSGETL